MQPANKKGTLRSLFANSRPFKSLLGITSLTLLAACGAGTMLVLPATLTIKIEGEGRVTESHFSVDCTADCSKTMDKYYNTLDTKLLPAAGSELIWYKGANAYMTYECLEFSSTPNPITGFPQCKKGQLNPITLSAVFYPSDEINKRVTWGSGDNPWGACVINTSNQLKCWGENAQGLPNMNEVRDATITLHNTCALDIEGIHCWGPEAELKNAPPMADPAHFDFANFFLSDTGACFLENQQVKCWGRNSGQYGRLIDVPALEAPTKLYGGYYTGHNACADTRTGRVCWGYDVFDQEKVPAGIINPISIQANNYTTCVTHAGGQTCWGQFTTPDTSEPQYGLIHCELSGNNVQCNGNNYFGTRDVPNLVNPRAVAAGRLHACAIDDTGIVCWGGKPKITVQN